MKILQAYCSRLPIITVRYKINRALTTKKSYLLLTLTLNARLQNVPLVNTSD